MLWGLGFLEGFVVDWLFRFVYFIAKCGCIGIGWLRVDVVSVFVLLDL